MAAGLIKRLLNKLTAASGPPRVLVGAFGKHPVHNEHIEDLGGESRLSEIFDLLYTDGIRAAVDKGVWQQLREEGKLLPFNHSIVWKMADQIVVGRIWASHDNLHRDRYPMAVVAVCPRASLSFALLRILPRMVELEKACVAATSLNGLRQVIQRCRASMPFIPAEETHQLDASDVEAATAYLCRRSELGPDCQGLINVMYQIDREMGGFLPVGDSTGTTFSHTISQRPVHLRVPCCGDTQAQSAAGWMRFLGGTLAGSSPILMLIPGSDSNWIDLLVGKPGEADFFYVRTSAETTPRTTDIPYKIPGDFTQQALDRINTATAAHDASESILPNQASYTSTPVGPMNGKASDLMKNTRLLAIASGAGLIALSLGAVWHHLHSRSPVNTSPEIGTPPAQASASTVPTGVTLSSAGSQSLIESLKPATRPALSASTPTQSTSVTAEPSSRPAAVSSADDAPLRARYLADLNRQTGPFTSPEFNACWRKMRDNYLQHNPVATVEQLRSAIASIGDSITWIETDHDLSSSPDLSWDSSAAWIAPLRKALLEIISKNRESAIVETISAQSPPGEADTSSTPVKTPIASLPPVVAFRQLKADARRLGAEWALIEQLMDDGVPLDTVVENTPSGNTSVRKLFLAWQSNPLFANANVRSALAPVHDKFLAMAHVDMLDRSELVEALSEQSTPTSLRLAVWRRLSEPTLHWPDNTAEFHLELSTRDQLLSQLADQRTAQAVVPPAWEAAVNDAITKEIHEIPAKRWDAFATRLPPDPVQADIHLRTASAELEPCGVDATAMPAPIRFNLALAQLHAQLARDLLSPDDAKLQEALQTFCDATRDLNINADSIGALDAIVKAPGDLTAASDGPGSLGFSPTFVNADTVDFTLELPTSKASPTIRFIRVGALNQPNRFVATSEMSVGLFIQAVTEYGDWKQFQRLVPYGAMGDGRLSPCVWKWNDGRMQVADSWLPSHDRTGILDSGNVQTDYPDQLRGFDGDLKEGNGNDATPGVEQPVQFISPHAAVCVASMLGCRLPTVDDWRAALKCDQTATVTTRPATQQSTVGPANNLRDKTWNLQQRYIQHLKTTNRIDPMSWPDFDSFRPANSISNAIGARAQSIPDFDDGVLWFRKVGAQIQPGNSSGHRFSDLVGNVAEYVTQDAPAADVWPKVSSAPIAREFVSTHMPWFKVIGGSALSAPEIPVDQPQPIDRDNALTGFSDVGFRLAFTSSLVPMRQRVADVLKEIQFASPR